jgi:hypothetical protein
LSRAAWKRQSNKGYEANHSAYGPVIICNRKQGSNRRIDNIEMMILNENCYYPATSTFLSVVDPALKSFHLQNMLLRIEYLKYFTPMAD